ncbi:hypothetical protein ACICHK_42435 (plasmid) [Streptomyces sp. AHU1]|uniref:hypothetical protein n=1 Tax=Streptomyces sp. AHU1 TaxID=3377215 RepID=UPI003877F371
MLRWFCERGRVHCPAHGAGVSQAAPSAGHLYKGIDVFADETLDLHEVLGHCQQGYGPVILDA